MCGILGPTVGEGWLAYLGVDHEYPDVGELADERATLWTWATVPAGMLPLGTSILIKIGHDTYEGKLRCRDRYDGPEFGNDRLGVDWQGRRFGARYPDLAADTEVEARVPVPFDLSALLAQIERETGARCRPAPRRRREGDRKRCDSYGRTGTRGFLTVPSDGGISGATYRTGRTACRRRAQRLTPPAVRAEMRRSLEVNT
jgi:hypothetical protein